MPDAGLEVICAGFAQGAFQSCRLHTQIGANLALLVRGTYARSDETQSSPSERLAAHAFELEQPIDPFEAGIGHAQGRLAGENSAPGFEQFVADSSQLAAPLHDRSVRPARQGEYRRMESELGQFS